MRADLDQFIDGTPLSNLSDRFRSTVAKLFFIPVAERSIEAKHSLAKMALHSTRLKCSTVNISLSNRLPILKNMFLEEPELFRDFLEVFQEARNHASASVTFRVENHPAVRDCVGKHHTKMSSAMRAILYRADFWSPTHSVSAAEKRHFSGQGSRIWFSIQTAAII
jgi:hypothetical protein